VIIDWPRAAGSLQSHRTRNKELGSARLLPLTVVGIGGRNARDQGWAARDVAHHRHVSMAYASLGQTKDEKATHGGKDRSRHAIRGHQIPNLPTVSRHYDMSQAILSLLTYAEFKTGAADACHHHQSHNIDDMLLRDVAPEGRNTSYKFDRRVLREHA